MPRRDIDYAEERVRNAYDSYVTHFVTPILLAGVILTVLPVLFLAAVFAALWLWR